MRDLAITFIVIYGCFYTLKKPYVGILLWSWLSYMNPHRLAFGFSYNMPFAMITAIVLLISMFLSKEKMIFPFKGITIIWVIFIAYMGITTVLAYYPDMAYIQYKKIIKIQFVALLTVVLITDMVKLRHLIWVICLSIGYYSVKGGIFTLISGGGLRVYGPPQSYIEENNGLAIAVLMIIPLMVYLYQTEKKKWLKQGLLFAIVTSLFTVLGSQSRGALLAIVAVGGVYWLKSNSKIISGFFIAIISVALLAFMPDSWFQRMDTIENYDEDASAMGRLNAWEYAFNAANHNVFGVGLESWTRELFALYAPNPLDVHVAHSIYFSILADHGWGGLFLFLLIFFLSWRRLAQVKKKTNGKAEFLEYEKIAGLLQISLIAYLSGGAFLSLSYFDLPWHLVSFAVILPEIFAREVEKLDAKQVT